VGVIPQEYLPSITRHSNTLGSLFAPATFSLTRVSPDRPTNPPQVPPLRLKKSAVAAFAIIATVRGFLLNFGVYHATRAALGLPFVWSPPIAFITVFVTVFATVIAITKDLPDVEGDKKFGIETFATRMGVRNIAYLGSGLLVANYLGAIALAVRYVTTPSPSPSRPRSRRRDALVADTSRSLNDPSAIPSPSSSIASSPRRPPHYAHPTSHFTLHTSHFRMPLAFNASVMIPCHALLAALLVAATIKLDKSKYSRDGIASYYRFIWYLFYSEYALLPFI